MKKVLLISGILLTFVIGVYFYYYSDSQKSVLENSKSKQIINSNSLTMMYETEYQSGEYQVSTETTWPQEGYTFNEALSKCENGGVLTWDDENKKVLLQTNTSDKCYVYFDKEPNTLASYIINNVYTGTDGENGLYYHDGFGTYTNADQEAGDYSYRYSGANPNNFVCFGSDEVTCPVDNLYRIIGVFNNQVKLIKSNFANSDLLGSDGANNGNSNLYYWAYKVSFTSTGRNDWNKSDLNKINLNQNFIFNIGTTWSSKIETYNWKIGGNTNDNIVNTTVKNSFINEIVNPSTNTIHEAKIGLMYASDYGYATSPDNWTTNLGNLNNDINTNNNWMFKGTSEWTITRLSNSSIDAIFISSTGYVSSAVLDALSSLNIRPTFYLNPDVQYISGTGTQTDPYRIA